MMISRGLFRSGIAFTALFLLSAVVLLAMPHQAWGFYDDFDDGVYTDKWTAAVSDYNNPGYPPGTVTEEGGLLHLYVEKPTSGICENAGVSTLEKFNSSNLSIEANILYNGYGHSGITIAGAPLNFIFFGYGPGDLPNLGILNAQNDNTSRTYTYFESSSIYRGAYHTLKIIKTGDTYDMYIDGVFKGSVNNPDIGDTDVYVNITSYTCPWKQGDVDTYADWIEILPIVPDIEVTDSYGEATDHQIAFGGTTVGTVSSPEVITVTNTGGSQFASFGVELTGDHPDDFQIEVSDPACGPSDEAPLNSCTIEVAFAPLNKGLKTAIVRITTDDPDEPTVDVLLTGTGTPESANNPPPVPELLFPGKGQHGIGSTVTLKWQAMPDPDGDPVTYDLYMDDDPGFSGAIPVLVAVESSAQESASFAGLGMGVMFFGIVLAGGLNRRRRALLLMVAALVIAGMFLVSCGNYGNGNSSGSNHSQIVEYHVSVSDLSASTTYYWKVAADDGHGGTSESPVWNFDTE